MRKVTASELSQFCYCEEQYRLSKLEKAEKITVRDPETVFIDSRLEEGTTYHQRYAGRYQQPQRSGCTSVLQGCLIVLLILMTLPWLILIPFWLLNWR